MLETVAWNDIAMILEGGQSVVVECMVEELYGNLELGSYEIKKKLTQEGTGKIVEVTAEFQIEE